MMPEAKKSVMFLMALSGESQTKIAEKLGMTKSEVHEIVTNKLLEYGIVYTIREFEEYTVWWKSVIRKELENLWSLL